MLTAFWDCRGPLMLDFMPRGSSINSDRYCPTLSLLRAAIRKKGRRILDVDNVIILHDNARPHVANKTVNKPRKFHWEFLEHPPYSPDLAPSDFPSFQSAEEVPSWTAIHLRRRSQGSCAIVVPQSDGRLLLQRHRKISAAMGQMSEPARGLCGKIVKGTRNNIYMFSSLYVSYYTSNKIWAKTF